MKDTLFKEKFSFLIARTDSSYFFARARTILPKKGFTHTFELCGKTREDFENIDLGGINFLEMSKVFERQNIDLVEATFTQDQLNELKRAVSVG